MQGGQGQAGGSVQQDTQSPQSEALLFLSLKAQKQENWHAVLLPRQEGRKSGSVKPRELHLRYVGRDAPPLVAEILGVLAGP